MHPRPGQWQNLYQLAGGSEKRSCLNGDFGSSDKDSKLVGARRALQSMPLLSKQSHEDNSAALGDNPLKLRSESSFYQFFVKSYLKEKGILSQIPDVKSSLKGKEVLSTSPDFNSSVKGKNKSPKPLGEFNAAASSKINEEQASALASDAMLLNSSVRIDQPCQSKIDKDGVVEISLREWLKPGCCEINKIERLNIFREIVKFVNLAHSQAVVLNDIRPSCFILLPSNKVKYIGASMLREIQTVACYRKRPLEQEMPGCSYSVVKQQKLVESKDCNHSSNRNISIPTQAQTDPAHIQLEEKWYATEKGKLSSNIFSLGILLFELLCSFESSGMHSTAMSNLYHRILPPKFRSENPKEAGFCLWLLHPEPSCRPTTREILQSELICESQNLCSGDDLSLYPNDDDDFETELLLDFLLLLKEQKQRHASKLVEDISNMEDDIKEIERRHGSLISSNWTDTNLNDAKKQRPQFEEHIYSGFLSRSLSVQNMLEGKLIRNISQLENAYFSNRSQIQLKETVAKKRFDKDLLTIRDGWCQTQNENEDVGMEGEPVDVVEPFFEGLCKFARYSKLELCGTVRNGDLLNTTNLISSLSFDHGEDYITVAGVSKRIKIFEFNTLLNDSVDIHYPLVEMSSKSQLSCVCWNKYIKNYIASTDYDGVVQVWDGNTGQALSQFAEHKKRAWSVDFSRVFPMKFASGSDDYSVKVWSINEKNSIETIRNPANVCCVQFSSNSSHLLAFGCADCKIYCYDLRFVKIPWCTLAGHGKGIGHLKFLDTRHLVSSSTDNTLKLWDLNKTISDGLSSGACSLTLSGHTNEKKFIGLSVSDGYIACGSETNEVYTYYKSLPLPITSHKFSSVDPVTGLEIGNDESQFVSSVCWRRKSNMVIAANSSGNMEILRIV